MTIQEYSTLIGYEETCEAAEYETANFIYMMAGKMDKHTFCKEYKEVGHSSLVHILAEAANRREIAYRDKETKERQIAHALLNEAEELRSSCIEDSADQIDKIAESLIGRKDCIKWKLSKDFLLSKADKEYVTDNLQ